ncbi:MAG TPA: hypothetical protein VGI66_03325 [Streptosporangiaceae bacterium]|jgi:hypothetical protein
MTTPPHSSPDIAGLAAMQQAVQAHQQAMAELQAELDVTARRTAFYWAAFVCTCSMAWNRDVITGVDSSCPIHSGVMLHYRTGEVIM